MISDADAEDCIMKYKATGNHKQLEPLITGNLRFVISVAKQYQYNKQHIDDLISYGNIGLIKAAERFDPSKGFKFISYAVWWIRQCIMEGLNETMPIKLPLNRVVINNKIKRCHDEMIKRENRHATETEIAEETGINLKDIKVYDNTMLKLDDTTHEESYTCIGDLIPDHAAEQPDRKMVYVSGSRALRKRMETLLDDRLYNIVALHYGFDGEEKTLEEIGSIMDLSRERVRQLLYEALKKLKRKEFFEIM
jgi:RNA polymerase primary sigma factor